MNIVGSLAIFRLLYCTWLGVAVVLQWRGHARWVGVRGEDRRLPRLLDVGPMPRLNRGGFTMAGMILLVCLAWAIAEDTGWPLLVASGFSLLYFAQVIELPAVRRKPSTVPVILALLGVAGVMPGADTVTVTFGVIVAVKVVVAQIYLSSAIVKVKGSGRRWTSGNTLRIALLRYYLRDGNRAAWWFVRRGRLCGMTSVLVLVFELTFWLVIPFPMLAWLYLPAGLIFHLGTAVLMRIHYWIYVVPAYFIFVALH